MTLIVGEHGCVPTQLQLVQGRLRMKFFSETDGIWSILLQRAKRTYGLRGSSPGAYRKKLGQVHNRKRLQAPS